MIRKCYRYFSSNSNSKPTIAVLGSGWGGFEFIKTIDKNKYNIYTISPADHFLFTPLLPSTAVGTLEFRCIQEPIRTISNVNYCYTKARNIDFNKKIIYCSPHKQGSSFS